MEKQEPGGQTSRHVLIFPYPAQGHINPMLQLGKRLAFHGLKVTMAITRYIAAVMEADASPVALDTISDGYDDGGYFVAASVEAYHDRLHAVGWETLTEVVRKYRGSPTPVTCLVYDAFLPWALDLAKGLGLLGAAFFSQSCAVNAVYYTVLAGGLELPAAGGRVRLPGLPELEEGELPSFVSRPSYMPAFREMLLGQFCNCEAADWVFCNSFDALETEVLSSGSKLWLTMKRIGPTIPSLYLDNRVEGDHEYGLSMWKKNSALCKGWLDTKADGSVVYVSFGSGVELDAQQMEELAWGLRNSDKHFVWVVRAREEHKLPANFASETSNQGMVVQWCPQLEVLAHPAVGCFVSHCGWNSTLEGLSLGVPMVAVPYWTDQPMNAKYLEEVWGIGLRATKGGAFTRRGIEACVREMMEGERGKEMKKKADRWRVLAKKAVDHGGSSDENIREFVAFVQSCCA